MKLGIGNEIVLAHEFANEFHKKVYLPLLEQFKKELGLKSIEKEIKKIYHK